jgi:hypothetical protein
MAHRLKIGEPDALGFVVRMADVIAYVRLFTAEFAFPAHDVFFLSSRKRFLL